MGVLGFAPFLQKTCPAAIKLLPNRLEALKGKRVVIDGNLITQRIYYGESSKPYRHVLGWHRLISALKKHDISVICVFDGKIRSDAKQEELQRRRAVQSLARARGKIEDARFQRLHELKASMDQLQQLNDETKQDVLKVLKQSEFMAGADSVAVLDKEIAEKESMDAASEGEPIITSEKKKKKPTKEKPTGPTTPADSEELASTLKSLYLSYKAEKAKVASSTTPKVQPEVTTEKQREAPPEKILTKQQYQLTCQEGEVWNSLSASVEDPQLDITATTSADLMVEILDRSHVMTSYYQKRNDRPTIFTYRECRHYLRGMGITVIKAKGAVEAEALAASFVLAGQADYVITEDTDVLVYEAPMIRNITSFSEPLMVISGAEARANLGLSREAYIDLALLFGTDFTNRITQLGPVRAYKYIKKHGCIENILQAIKDSPRIKLNTSSEAYLAQIAIARLIYGTLPPIPIQKELPAYKKKWIKILFNRVMRKYKLPMLFPFNSESPVYTLKGNAFDDDPSAA